MTTSSVDDRPPGGDDQGPRDGGSTRSQQDTLSRDELKERASAGVFIVATRGLVILLLGVAGNVVVARFLSPHDFGVIAIGASFVLFAGLISDGGLAGGLIRRPVPPSAAELGAFSALQLGVTCAAAVVAAAAAGPFGRAGWVTAIMVASMPFVAVQFPGRILLERSLLYRRLAVVELSQVICYQAWAIGTVLAGFGVWGLATATVVRSGAGALAMALACPAGNVRPRPSARLVKPLLGFGVRFQAVNATWLIRDQLLNASVAALSGIDALGLWTLAKRLMEVPYLIFQSLWRVSFPAMSRLVANQEAMAGLVERAVGISVVGTGFVLVGMAGGAPGLVPGLFGAQWHDASGILPWACLGLAVVGPISVSTQGFLFAVGDASSVLRAELLQAVSWFAVTLPLLHVVGIAAAGIGWCVSSVLAALVLSRATTRQIKVRLLRVLAAPVAVGVIASSFGWVLSPRLGSGHGAGLGAGILGGGSAVLLFALGLAVVNRTLLRATYRFAAEAVRTAVTKRQG